MPQDEAEREHATTRETHFMPAGGSQVHRSVRLLPAFDLSLVPRICPLVEGKGFARIMAWLESVVRRAKIEQFEIDRIVSETVDLVDCIAKAHARPWAFAKLVGVVVDEPVGMKLRGELFLPV